MDRDRSDAIAPDAIEAISDLCARFRVRRLDLFGSAGTKHFDPAKSDLDFLVSFEDLPPGERGDALWGLREGLERLFGREIDLLTKASLQNPYLRRRIESQRHQLFPTLTMSVDAAKYLWDVRRALERIRRFVSGRTFEDYLADELLRPAVERQLEIAGEALRKLRQIDPELAEPIPALALVIAFRNILVHAYTDIDNDKVWETLERDLPILIETVDRLLETKGPDVSAP